VNSAATKALATATVPTTVLGTQQNCHFAVNAVPTGTFGGSTGCSLIGNRPRPARPVPQIFPRETIIMTFLRPVVHSNEPKPYYCPCGQLPVPSFEHSSTQAQAQADIKPVKGLGQTQVKIIIIGARSGHNLQEFDNNYLSCRYLYTKRINGVPQTLVWNLYDCRRYRILLSMALLSYIPPKCENNFDTGLLPQFSPRAK